MKDEKSILNEILFNFKKINRVIDAIKNLKDVKIDGGIEETPIFINIKSLPQRAARRIIDGIYFLIIQKNDNLKLIMSQVEIKILGEDGIMVRFEEKISIKTNLKVQNLRNFLLNEKVTGIKELIPSYRSLLVLYDPTKISYEDLKETLSKFQYKKKFLSVKRKKVFEIPAYFGSDLGIDLPYVSKYHKLSEENVIKILLKNIYYVYMFGFLPGFIYLGGLRKILHTPRLESPRVSVPKGSIGIGGEQLGIYSISSPGGFRIIGLTYLNLIEIENDVKIKIKEGDFIKFKRISKDEFLKNYKEEIKFL